MTRPVRRIGTGSVALLLAAGVAAVATPGPAVAATVPDTGYIAQPVEQLALPGSQASGEITPEGDIYTGWAEYELSIGPRLGPWSQPTRILPTPSLPRLESRVTASGVAYTQDVFTVPVGGRPVVYLTLTARNQGRSATIARTALGLAYSRGPEVLGFHGIKTGAYRYERPAPDSGDGYFSQLGAAFDPGWTYATGGRDVDRSGLLLVRGPARGEALPVTGTSASPTAVRARVAYRQRLKPGAAVSWTWQIPLDPPAAGAAADRQLDAVSPSAARRLLTGFWRGQERGLTQISVPEARVNDVLAANEVAILQARYLTPSGWVQGVNRLQYQSYWIRDSSVNTVALDQVGLHAAAAQNLSFLAHWQQPSGLYISRPGQQDGIGQALWELTQHALLVHSAAFAAAQLPHVAAAVDWIEQATASDSLGLLPPSTIADDEFLAGSHITGDNVWAADGLRSAVELATMAGRPDLAAAWRSVDRRFEQALDAAIGRATARAGHIPPGLDASGGFDWGNYWAAYPLPILSPRSAAVRSTVRWFDAHSREGLATYHDGATLHDYLGFPVFQTQLSGGQVAAALSGFYAELAHTTAPGLGWEDGPRPFGGRQSTVNLTPHGTFSGQFVSMLRDLLVREDGTGVDLLSGVSPAWMRPGDRIAVRNAPTADGTMTFTLSTARSGGGATLHWTRAGSGSGTLRWVLPYWVTVARTGSGASVRGSLRLPGRSGTVALRWSARAPALSAARTAAALNRSYRAHGKAAPIVPAPGW